MKKYLFILPMALVLCSCEAVKERVVKNEAQKLYNSFWELLYENYVNFGDADYDAIYEKGFNMLSEIPADSINTQEARRKLMACADSIVNDIRDQQLLVWSGRMAAEYMPEYENSGLTIFPGENAIYNAEQLANMSGSHFFSISRLADGKKFYYFVPQLSTFRWSDYPDFVEANMQVYAEDDEYEGMIIDLRGRFMYEDYMCMYLQHFLPDKDTVIFYTQQRTNKEDRHALSEKTAYRLRGLGTCCSRPVVAIIDGGTAGVFNICAHVLAGCSNVTTVGMAATYPSGTLTKTLYITNDQNKPFASTMIPALVVSNDVRRFSESLEPMVKLPFEGKPSFDQNIVTAMDVICSKK